MLPSEQLHPKLWLRVGVEGNQTKHPTALLKVQEMTCIFLSVMRFQMTT